MTTPKSKSPSIFRAKKIELTQPIVDATVANIKERTGVSDELLDRLDFKGHVVAVKELADKIIDLFEQGSYDTHVALDAIETVLKGGVSITLGDVAGELLHAHLEEFHKELAAIQIIKMLASLGEKEKLGEAMSKLSAVSNMGEKEPKP